MPRRVILDAHEWVKEVPFFHIRWYAKLRHGERVMSGQRGKKSLLSLTVLRGSFATCVV